MLLTCENCKTQYNLSADKIGAAGRSVRCKKCLNVWFVTQDGKVTEKPQKESAPAEPPAAKIEPSFSEEPTAEEMAMALGQILESLPETAATAEKQVDIPPVVKLSPMAQEMGMPVIEDRPSGMGAVQFGLFIFLLLFFATLVPLFLFRGPLTQHFPAMAAIYKPLGIQIKAPGEGLKLSEMTAVMGSVRVDVSAKLSNISSHDIDYPPLKIVLKSAYGAELKSWNMKGSAGVLTPGQTIPVMISLAGFPEGGKTMEMSVSEEE
jgi:predicted Zn finger-like uncharacterized protein